MDYFHGFNFRESVVNFRDYHGEPPSAVMTWSDEMWTNVGTQVNSCRNWGTVLSELGSSVSELGYSIFGTGVQYVGTGVQSCRNSGHVGTQVTGFVGTQAWSVNHIKATWFDDRSIYLRTIIIYLRHSAQVPLQDWRFKKESEFQLFRKQPLSYPLQMMLYMLNLHL